MPVHKKIPRGKFFIEDRVNANGEATIYIRYYLQRYAKRSTGISIPPTAWDEENSCVKASHPNASRINLALQNFKCDIDNRLMDYDGDLNLTVLNFILNGGDPTNKGDLPDESPTQVVNKNTNFVEYCKKVNDLKYGKKEYGYSMWYNKQKIIEQFETFLIHWRKTPKFTLKDLRADVFDEYVQYRFTVLKNTSKEAVNKTLVPLFVAIKQAVLYGIIDTKLAAPIVDNYLETHETEYKPDMEEEVVEHIRYLKPEQIERLKDYQSKCKNQRSKEILDMWFFAYYACGLRLSDILTLEWKHIDWEAKVIKKVQFKTKRLPDVLPVLGNSAMEILNRWKGYGRNDKFVFDLLPEDYDLTDQKRLFMDRNSKDKTFNTSLNVARMTLRFEFPLTMHVARHSFAVMAINKGMSLFLLSKLLGHSTIASTQRTYAEFLKETVDSETKFIREL
jgi:integrase